VSIRITETGAALGAHIEGIDLTSALDEATFAAVRNAFYKYEVVYFRGSELSDEDHIRFSERFGELRKLKLDQLHAKHPEIFIVSNIVATFDYALPLRGACIARPSSTACNGARSRCRPPAERASGGGTHANQEHYLPKDSTRTGGLPISARR